MGLEFESRIEAGELDLGAIRIQVVLKFLLQKGHKKILGGMMEMFFFMIMIVVTRVYISQNRSNSTLRIGAFY